MRVVKTKTAGFRTTNEDFDKYNRCAEREGIFLGEWIRRMADKEAKKIERLIAKEQEEKDAR